MKPMTQRERILAALRGDEVDRTPTWLLFPWDKTSYYTDVRNERSFTPVVTAMREKAAVLNRRNFDLDPFSADFRRFFPSKSFASSLSRQLAAGEVTAENSSPLIAAGRFLDDEADLETFLSLPVLDDEAAVGGALEHHLPRYLAEREAFPGDAGAMMLDLGEPILTLYQAANLLEYPVWSITHRSEIADFLRRLQAHFLAKYRFCLERELAEVYFLVGSELAAPPMVGPESFRDWVMPFQKELIDLIRSYGKLSITHFHGQIRDRLDDFLALGPDGLHTIEEPPTGNCPLGEALERVDNRITLIGTIQYDQFRSAEPEEMRAEVRRVLDTVRGRRFILSPSAGPFHPVLDDRMRDNYLAFLDEGSIYHPSGIQPVKESLCAI